MQVYVASVVRYFLYVFHTMASSAGRETMNGEAVGSIPIVIPSTKKKEISGSRLHT